MVGRIADAFNRLRAKRRLESVVRHNAQSQLSDAMNRILHERNAAATPEERKAVKLGQMRIAYGIDANDPRLRFPDRPVMPTRPAIFDDTALAHPETATKDRPMTIKTNTPRHRIGETLASFVIDLSNLSPEHAKRIAANSETIGARLKDKLAAELMQLGIYEEPTQDHIVGSDRRRPAHGGYPMPRHDDDNHERDHVKLNAPDPHETKVLTVKPLEPWDDPVNYPEIWRLAHILTACLEQRGHVHLHHNEKPGVRVRGMAPHEARVHAVKFLKSHWCAIADGWPNPEHSVRYAE